jgi:ADP-heptose:LPS heptosyltransferase
VILALRALGVGDLATAVPALRGLRVAYPDRPLVLAAPRWLEPLASCVDAVDRVLPVDGLAPRALPSGDVVVNLHGRGPESHHLLLASEPGELLAFACPDIGFRAGPEWTEEEHEVTRWCRLLRWYGIACDPDDLALARPVPDRVPVGATVLHPGAKSPSRRWPAERFGALARALTAAGHRVVVSGSPAERGLAARVASLGGLPGTAVFAGRTDVADLAALVAYARVVVCGDTGVAHLATAYRTSSVLLFAGMSPARWGPPPGRPWHRVLWHPELAATSAGGGPEPAPASTMTPTATLAMAQARAPGTAAGRPTRRAQAAGERPHPALLAIEVDDVLEALDAVATW